MAGVMVERSTRNQEPVDEHQPVLRTRSHGPLPRPRGKPGLVTLMPQQTHLGDKLSNYVDPQAP